MVSEGAAESNAVRCMTEAVLRLVAGNAPEGLPADLHPGEGEIGRLFEAVDALMRSFGDARGFIAALSEGRLDAAPPSRNFLVSPFKQLHANLRHLTWQTLAVAKGDLSQKVDFLGEFSVAFNGMISALREKRILEEELRVRTEALVEANTNVMASIQYARTIQNAFLPGEGDMAAHLEDFFVTWKPRDIIGGDLYSFKAMQGGFLLAVMDCTGHGVPVSTRSSRKEITGIPGIFCRD